MLKSTYIFKYLKLKLQDRRAWNCYGNEFYSLFTTEASDEEM